MKKSQLILFIFLIFIQGCGFRHEKTSGRDSNRPQSSPRESALSVGYKEVHEKVLSKNCLGCHSTHPPTLTNYESVSSVAPSIYRVVFVDKIMPPAQAPQLTQEQLDLLKNWIDAKAPLNPIPKSAPEPSPAPSPPPSFSTEPTPPPNWSQLKKQVVEVSCASCHFEKNQRGLIDLTQLKTFKASIGTILYLTLVEHESPMPPPPRRFSVEQKKLLTDWVIGGQNED